MPILLDPAGKVLGGHEPDIENTLTADDIRRLTAMEAICQKFNLVVVCPKCTELFGAGKDGVEGKNDPGMRGSIELRCGCTRRVYQP